MNQIQRIVKNISVTGLAQVLTALMSFVLLIYLARFLGEADFGKYSFAFSLTTLLATLTDLGVNQLLVREIARNKDISEEYVNNAVMMKVPLAAMTFMVIVAVSWILNLKTDVMVLLYLFGFYNVLLTVSNTYVSLFQAWERMEYAAILQIIERVFTVALGLAVLILGYGVIAVACVYAAAGVLDVAISVAITSRRFLRPSLSFNPSLQRKLLVMGLPFGLNSLFAMFFFKIDTVLLGIMKDDVAVGIYNAAYNPLLSLSMIISGMVSAAIYPVMSRYFTSDADSLETFTMVSCRYLSILGFPIAAGCLVFADRFIELFYGGGYLGAILAFQILALFIPIRLVSTVTGTLLTSINRQGFRMLSVGLSAVLNIVLNVILIPAYSYIGASAATVISEVFLYLLFLFYIWRHYRGVNVSSTFTRPALASIVMALAIYPLRDMSLIITVALASCVYFAVLAVIGGFREEDRMMIMNILGRD
ncbi:flippase [Methanothermobacter sp. KEPCO 2]|uniref:flippase n=1 Tax=Methanothermobacter sp. KEPCO 2 TaxID=3240977 RepID=UPI0035115D41